MKTTFQILILILLVTQTNFAQIITVKQDSTGDYITIQEAVTAATTGDTVLVWPGTYFESIYIEEKGIVVGSLNLTTGDETYIRQTIVDGNHEAGCIVTYYCEDRVEINGFTLRNGNPAWYGTGINGGGILVWYSNTDILNCVIQHNNAYGGGGGIYYGGSEGRLSNITIRNNHAHFAGGGLLSANSEVSFDTINKCNIYLNTASQGTDVYNSQDGEHPLYVVLDTCTVLNPDYYYLHEFTNPGGAVLSHEISAGKITQTNQDLYVSPDGNNSNSGLTPQEPLQTISFALLKMASDSLSPDTLHVANGIYSQSTNAEKYPLSLKKYASIQGESRDSTILDAEDIVYLMQGIDYADEYKISRLTLQNGNGDDNSYFGVGGFRAYQNDNTLFEDLLFNQNKGDYLSCFLIRQSNGVLIKRVDFIDNSGGKAFRSGSNTVEGENYYDTTTLINCRFIQNNLNDSIPDGGAGGGFSVMSQLSAPGIGTAVLINCLFENHQTRGSMLSAFEAGHAYLINCTIADNFSSSASGVIGAITMSEINAYNSIFYNNQPAEFYMYNEFPTWGDTKLNIYHSNVEGGEEDIEIVTEGNQLYYDASNIDEDPVFLNKWDHPYQIADGSPCIDAGTLTNLPDFIQLPETDLAGNPRIIGDSIDMGAYEWNPTVGVDENLYQAIQNNKPRLLHAAPNPFSIETTISAKWDFTGHVQIDIYNNAGLRVKVLKSGASGYGSIQSRWDGKDQNGNVLPAGIYHVVMHWEGKEQESLKVVVQ